MWEALREPGGVIVMFAVLGIWYYVSLIIRRIRINRLKQQYANFLNSVQEEQEYNRRKEEEDRSYGAPW